MSSADQAMYAAKTDRHTSYKIFDREKYGEALNLNTMETVRQAIQDGEFQPWYQPKVDIQNGNVVGFEALARWIKPDGSILHPDEFLPLIKQHNLQTEFTFSILRNALSQLAFWDQLDGPTPGVAINMVEELLASPDACNDVNTLLQSYGNLASLITFEITEDVFFDRGLLAIQCSIQQLIENGVQFSMDDFGTGFGSFQHLRKLALHELKIDIEFVQGIGKDRSAEVIIEGFISIARGLALGITAEGIETKAQAEFLIRRGCHIGQGFLYSPALPSDLATAFLTNPNTRISA
jgi:EAL domain-containing protein (putative c-di-GMP-specific phosphodiesterase class I)